MIKRSAEDKAACLLQIQMLKQTPGWKIYEMEVMRIKLATADGMYKETGEGLAKAAGILRGMDLALNIEMLLPQPK